MCENAELWAYCDENSQRLKLYSWFKSHNIKYNENLSLEELRQLYIDIECGKYKI